MIDATMCSTLFEDKEMPRQTNQVQMFSKQIHLHRPYMIDATMCSTLFEDKEMPRQALTPLTGISTSPFMGGDSINVNSNLTTYSIWY